MTRPDAPHYTHSGSVECIDAIYHALGHSAFIDYCRGAAMKYLWRCRHNGNVKRDLEKARDMIVFALERIA